MKTLGFVLGVALGCVGGALAAKEAAKQEIVQLTAGDLKWRPVAPGMPILASEGWTGPGGSHCSFSKFPGGFSEPPHFHTHDLHAVVIAGKWGAATAGEPKEFVTAGGYQFIPGGLEHLAKCGSKEDCVVYGCGPGAFDVKELPAAPKK